MTLPDPDFWRGRRVLVTGATGFKGGWLALWLAHMGATVTGYGLPAAEQGIFGATGLARRITPVTADIRHDAVMRECLSLMRPDVVFHLAQQSRPSWARANPVETFDVNVLGTAKLMEALRRARSVRTAVVMTAAGVYENSGTPQTETARLGARDICGASMVAAEAAVAALRESLGPDHRLRVATVRAGHPIGGGDDGEDRLIPDALNAFAAGDPLRVLHPEATRPWLHVLDALCGSLLVAERMAAGDPDAASAWNFGPSEDGHYPVSMVADRLAECWNADPAPDMPGVWRTADDAPPAPAAVMLDSGKAQQLLGWRERKGLDEGVQEAVAWHKAVHRGEDLAAIAADLLDAYSAG